MFEGLILSIAYGLASQHRLESEGVIWCWNCSNLKALLPSLRCHVCLAAYHRSRGTVGTCPNRPQTPADVEACHVR